MGEPGLIRRVVRALAAIFLLTIALVTVARRVDSGWIAFSSIGLDGDRAIYLMSGDGRAQRRLTPDHLCGNSPLWSPDGRWLALLSACSGENNLLRMGIGSRLQPISAELPHILNAEWSRDGQRLLARSQTSDLYIVEADDGSARLLASGYYGAQWSPDGEWIYARPLLEGNINLERIHVETGAVEHLLVAFSISELSWSPDESQILLRTGLNELVRMNPDGSAREPIPIDLSAPEIREAMWSPDGEWIVFTAGEGLSKYIYRARPNGRDLERLTQRAGNVWLSQWSGEWLLFTTSYYGTADIFRVRGDGSGLENLTQDARESDYPQAAPVAGQGWRPLPMILAALGMVVVPNIGRIFR